MTSYNDSDDVLGTQIWQERHDLHYRVQLSVLYHRKRERFFDVCDKVVKAIAVIAASSAITPLVAGGYLNAVQLLIVITSTFALVFDWSGRARRHSDFAVRYAQMERDMVAKGVSEFSTEDLKRWGAELVEVQSGEPAALHGLVQVCQDELDMAAGVRVEPSRLTVMRKMLAHLGLGSMDVQPQVHAAPAQP